MRFWLAILDISIALAFASGVGQAAECRSIDMPDGSGHGIVLSGVIADGDEIAFHKLAEAQDKAVVLTTGPGGIVGTAVTIGSEVRARGWATLVPPGAQCASACSLIWLAGQPRMLGAGAQIGFHAMSVMMANGQLLETHNLDVFLRKWLTDLGYPFDAAATIVNTEAASVRWFDTTELRANGIPTDPYP
jgi:hypothetical protein